MVNGLYKYSSPFGVQTQQPKPPTMSAAAQPPHHKNLPAYRNNGSDQNEHQYAYSGYATHHAHETAESTTAPAAHHPAELGLDEELHDRHRRAIHSILLVPRGGSSRLVKQLARLGHRHADELALRAATASSTRGEFFQNLDGSDVYWSDGPRQPWESGRMGAHCWKYCTCMAAAPPMEPASRLLAPPSW